MEGASVVIRYNRIVQIVTYAAMEPAASQFVKISYLGPMVWVSSIDSVTSRVEPQTLSIILVPIGFGYIDRT